MTNTTVTKLSNATLAKLPANVAPPKFDRSQVKEGVLHIGVGGFHRSHQALYLDDLMGLGKGNDWGISGVGIMPQDAAMNSALKEQDCLYTLVERIGDKSNARIIGALKSYLFGHQDAESVFAKMADPAIKIVSLTATEGGYCFNQGTGELDLDNKSIQNDLRNPLKPQTIFGYLAEGLERRRQSKMTPFTVLSCDNLQGNGHVAKSTLMAFCNEKNPELAKWIAANVAFPNCMVDRITPATTDAEREFVRTTYNVDDAFPVVAEPFKQWVIEDEFCNGRPELELVGVQFTSDVAPYEKMKIRLLNATHSAMGYLGYLCGYRYIYEIAKAPEFAPYLKAMMNNEVTPLIGSIPGVNLDAYKASLLERFGNEQIKDQALRICMDGSSKMPKFILPSIAEQLERGGSIRNLTLCLASWIRFLAGSDYEGKEIPIQDPQAERLSAIVKTSKNDPKPLLALSDIFGELGKSEKLVAETELLLNMLYDKGPQNTLQFVVESSK